MSVMKWLRAKRVRALRLELCQVEAEQRRAEELTKFSRTVYPTSEEARARLMARLKFLLAELEQKL